MLHALTAWMGIALSPITPVKQIPLLTNQLLFNPYMPKLSILLSVLGFQPSQAYLPERIDKKKTRNKRKNQSFRGEN